MSDIVSPATRSRMMSGIKANDKVYDGATTATLDAAALTLAGKVVGDQVNVASSGVFADKKVGAGKTVSLTHNVSGADVGNYAIAAQTGATAAITPKALNVAIVADNKTYDGGVAATVSANGIGLSGLVSGDVVTVSSSGVFADKNVGVAKAVALTNTLGGVDRDNYAITAPTAATATITPKALSVGGIVVANKTYDGTVNATVDTRSLSLSGLVSGDTVTHRVRTARTGGCHVRFDDGAVFVAHTRASPLVVVPV